MDERNQSLSSVRVSSFRNLTSLELAFGRRISIVVGQNGVGKTNLVEAISLLTTGRTFRRLVAWGDLIRTGEEGAAVSAVFQRGSGTTEIAFTVDSSHRRKVTVNGKGTRRAADTFLLVPAVIFCPDDLRLVKGAAEERRDALDSIGEKVSRAYESLAGEYRRVIRQRNAALRNEESDPILLEELTLAAARTGARLLAHRIGLFEKMKEHFTLLAPVITQNESVSVSYESRDGCLLDGKTGAREIQDTLLRRFEERAVEERARRVSLVGPHRDDVVFTIDGRPAREFASQGQQRALALSWKMAEVGVIEDVVGSRPLLLLDDVMSEFDDLRRQALTDMLGRGYQTIITTTTTNYFQPEDLSAATVIRL